MVQMNLVMLSVSFEVYNNTSDLIKMSSVFVEWVDKHIKTCIMIYFGLISFNPTFIQGAIVSRSDLVFFLLGNTFADNARYCDGHICLRLAESNS